MKIVELIVPPMLALGPGRYYLTDPDYVEDELKDPHIVCDTYTLWNEGDDIFMDTVNGYQLGVDSGRLALIHIRSLWPLPEKFEIKQHRHTHLEILIPIGPETDKCEGYTLSLDDHLKFTHCDRVLFDFQLRLYPEDMAS